MRVYVAGPMTGHPNHNFPAFHAVAAEWREAGYDVVNPAEHDEAVGLGHPWDFYLRRDLALLVECQGIVLLPNWSTSKGARLEFHVACELGLAVLLAEHPPRKVA